MNLIDTILQNMSTISTPQRKFIITALTTIQLLRGKMTFRNLSRYSNLHEKTFARQFQKSFDFAHCNELALTTCLPKTTTKIAAIDWTFVSKSGNPPTVWTGFIMPVTTALNGAWSFPNWRS